MEATVEATMEATVEATMEATAEATMEATEEAAIEATAEATMEATAEATMEATEEAAIEATQEITEDGKRTVALFKEENELKLVEFPKDNELLNKKRLIAFTQPYNKIPKAPNLVQSPPLVNQSSRWRPRKGGKIRDKLESMIYRSPRMTPQLHMVSG